MAVLLSRSSRSIIFKDKIQGIQDVVWKVSNESQSAAKNLLNEFSITEKLKIKGIRKPIQKGIYENKEAYAYKYFKGSTIKSILDKGPIVGNEFAELAVSITTILHELHQAGLLHLRINSNNILINPTSKDIQIIDFTAAAFGTPAIQPDLAIWDSEIAYAAPEQVGQGRSTIDQRTDLYCLGILFYEILTGTVPFSDDQNANLVHAHLVQIPRPASEINPNVDPVLSQITDKLLAKNPKDRYQTAYGLQWDIAAFKNREIEEKTSVLVNFGIKDQSTHLTLSKELFGRKNELRDLNDGLDKIAKGANSFYLIHGESGVGKSSLVQHFEHSVHEKDGLLIYGTFSQFDQNLPHRGLISALKNLGSNILSQPSNKHEEWKAIIKGATGEIGQALTEIIPEFEWLMESQPQLANLSGSQTQNRINFLFQRILQEVATINRPLVLFMDNIQWADDASWNSILSIIGDRSINHFMFIGAYRPRDKENALLHEKINRIKKVSSSIQEINLTNLGLEDIQNFIDQSIKINDLTEFSDIIYSKTHGNPFYIRQFLFMLNRTEILKYSPVLSQWVWDKEKMKKVQESDNVIQFLSEKVKQLPARELNVLIHGACIGKTFNVNLLNEILKGSEPQLGQILSNILAEDLVESINIDTYSFTHDRVQEAVLELSTEDIRSAIHFSIAEQIGDLQEDPNSETIFKLARHYNLAKTLIPESLLFHVSQVNMNAGILATKTADFGLALEYFKAAIETIKESDWDIHYEFVLELYSLASESGMITGALDDAGKWLDILLSKARNTTDRIKAHEIKLNHFTETHQFAETITHLLTVLDEIGYGIKRNPSKVAILKELVGVKWLMLNKNISDIPNLPAMKDERALAFMKLTVSATTSIFGHAPDILPIVFFRLVRLSLKYGNSEYAPFGYISYGFAISVFMGQINQGYDFGKMALELVDKLNAQIVKTKVLVIFYGFLSYWKESLRASIAPLKKAYFIGRQSGDLLYASFASSFHSGIRFYCGDNLQVLLELMTEDCQTINHLNQELVYQISEVQRQFLINLVEVKDNPLEFTQYDFDEDVFLKKIDEIGDQATKFDLYCYKLSLGCFFNNYDEAYKNAIEAGKFEDETTSRQINYPSFLMFAVTAQIKILTNLDDLRKKRRLKKSINKKIKLLEEFSKLAPQNYSNKVSFLKALRYQSEGQNMVASEHYYKAISESQKAGFIHEEALAREHFAYCYMALEMKEYAEMMLQKSFSCYQSWGAVAKCDQLKKSYPEIILSNDAEDTSVSRFQNIFDLNTIISANQALSSEYNLEGLLKRTLDIFVNNASTSKVVIILKDRNGLMKGKALAFDQEIKLLSGEEMEINYPESIINFVVRSKTTLVSSNFTEETKYRFDPYVQLHTPKSVCCIPIISKKILMGAVYLENNLAENTFDLKRVEFYKTICAQFAISLDNVVLYSEMEEKVKERTIEIAEKNELLTLEKKKSDDLLLNILPADTAEELKNHGKTTARLYENVTVLFCDIKDFTLFAEKLSPKELVHQLDICFKEFDKICKKHGLEKIKTIGDAYIAAGGVPKNNFATPQMVINTAIDMQNFTKNTYSKWSKEGKEFFKIRIGINTGPVVAGVVGSKKFQFDIWGDTVNLAARMEQTCDDGKINISKSTYEQVKNEFKCISRGKVLSKNKGALDMYYIEMPS